jgi:hypothetical protein
LIYFTDNILILYMEATSNEKEFFCQATQSGKKTPFQRFLSEQKKILSERKIKGCPLMKI